ncbi:MAG: hypothetical protein KDA96_13930 [Planctomycetaceae bacterium]|nr:hypothetical protein [Planctomycetaceae bacterium]
MKLSAILKWMLILTLLIVTIVGGVAVWAWRNSDQMVRKAILDRCEQMAPDLLVHINRVELLSSSSIRLHGVEVRDRTRNAPLVRVEQILVGVDGPALLDRQQVIVTSVEAQHVDLLVRRNPEGRWNWQDYRFVKSGDTRPILPTITVTDLRTQIQLQHGDDLPSANLVLASSTIRAVPASADRFELNGDVALPGTGRINLAGLWDRLSREWSVAGRMQGVHAGKHLIDLAQSANPGISEKLDQLDQQMARALPEGSIRHESPDESTALVIGTSGIAPRFHGVLDVEFFAASRPDQTVPDFSLSVQVRDGRIMCPTVPVRLTDVEASFLWDNQQAVVEVRNASDGDARLTGRFSLGQGPDAGPATAELKVTDLHVSSRFKPLFPERSQRFFEHFQPDGKVSGEVSLIRNGDGRWVTTQLEGSFRNATSIYHKFQYPVQEISGTFKQRPPAEGASSGIPRPEDILLDIQLTGRAGERPVTASGTIRHPGPMAETSFQASVDGFPLDERFRDALDEAGRRVIDSLDIEGTASVSARFHREPGLDQPTQMQLSSTVTEARMNFRGFRYEIHDLSGDVTYDSETRFWEFRNLKGRHGSAQLNASGAFRGLHRPGILDLTVRGEDIAVDSDLYAALAPAQQRLWSMLEPRGTVSGTTQIHWTAAPGQKPVVQLPRVRLTNGSIYPQPFPYRMSVDVAEFSFDPNDPRFAGVQHCEILQFRGGHGDSRITATGWAELTPDDFWQLHLNDLNAYNLQPDDELRAALPASWRDTLTRLKQAGRIAIESSELDFRGRGTAGAPPTAAWNMNLRLHNCDVSAGLDLSDVSGIVVANGWWDGYELHNTGDIRLDTVEVLEMSLTEVSGPYYLNNDDLLLGHRVKRDASGALTNTVAPLRATAYEGDLLLESRVLLGKDGGYRLHATLNNALLQSYAVEHFPDQRNMRGVVNAWIELNGIGDSAADVVGDGQMMIAPAAMYELPVFVQLFSALGQLNFSVPDNTAFNFALMSFRVENEAFRFDKIDLNGDSLALRGLGHVGFGGDVWLDFYSRPPRSQNPAAFVNALFTQWVGVEVRGTVNDARTHLRSNIRMDDSMRQLLGQFTPDPNAPVPTLNVPDLFGLPRRTQTPPTFPMR